MSIANEIQRIKNNIANAYTICKSKGAVIPEAENSGNLSSAINSISGAAKYGITVDNFLGDVDENGELKLPVSGTLNAKGIVKADDYVLACKFGGSAWGTSRPQGLSHIIFPDLKYVGCAGMAYFYTYSTDLETIEFPELEEIGQCGMQDAFQWNSKLKSASFPKLKRLTGLYSGLNSAFVHCSSLETVNFDSLESLTSSALSSAFGNCSKLTTLSFPSLNTESFGSYNNQFNSMLSRVTGCTVHFPIAIKDTIKDWASVIAGFSGTNTTILFDLHRVLINFITDKTTIKFSLNGKEIDGTSDYAPSGNVSYAGYDSETNNLYFGTLENLKDDESIDVAINADTGMNKIALSTGVSGLDVTFIAGGMYITAKEESGGIYYINTNSNGDTISYFVNGGDSYSDAEGEITTTGADITIPITIKTAKAAVFTRPNLTANGELGGDSFAVAGTGEVNSYYGPYKTMDGNTDYWWASGDVDTLTFYNPQALKVSQLDITYSSDSTSYQASKIVVQGSNDNSKWYDLVSVDYEAGQTRSISVNSNKYYKYHKLTLTEYSVYIRITDIGITATYKE